MNIFIFFGKPGCGKTTLINNLFPKEEIIDALTFVKAYEIDGKIPEEKTICAYRDTYNHITRLDKEKLIVEFGTGHPEYNLQLLNMLSKSHDLHIFLCDATRDTCFQRATKRSREMDQVALLRRLNRDFPDSHLQLFKKSSLSYSILDMEKPLGVNIKQVKKILKEKYGK